MEIKEEPILDRVSMLQVQEEPIFDPRSLMEVKEEPIFDSKRVVEVKEEPPEVPDAASLCAASGEAEMPPEQQADVLPLVRRRPMTICFGVDRLAILQTWDWSDASIIVDGLKVHLRVEDFAAVPELQIGNPTYNSAIYNMHCRGPSCSTMFAAGWFPGGRTIGRYRDGRPKYNFYSPTRGYNLQMWDPWRGEQPETRLQAVRFLSMIATWLSIRKEWPPAWLLSAVAATVDRDLAFVQGGVQTWPSWPNFLANWLWERIHLALRRSRLKPGFPWGLILLAMTEASMQELRSELEDLREAH